MKIIEVRFSCNEEANEIINKLGKYPEDTKVRVIRDFHEEKRSTLIRNYNKTLFTRDDAIEAIKGHMD